MQVDLSSNETVPRTIQTSAVDSEVVMELESANSNTNVGSEVAIDLESDNSNTDVDSEVVMELESANSNTNVGSEVAIDLESDNSNTVTLANTTLLYIHLKYNKTK